MISKLGSSWITVHKHPFALKLDPIPTLIGQYVDIFASKVLQRQMLTHKTQPNIFCLYEDIAVDNNTILINRGLTISEKHRFCYDLTL